MNEEQRPERYAPYAQDGLNLHILCMFEGTFLLDAAHMISYIYQAFPCLFPHCINT